MTSTICLTSKIGISENFAILFSVIFSSIGLFNYVDSVSISFTKPLYNVGIYQDQDVRKYVTHYDFQMGIKKPKENGDISFRIRDSSEIYNTFEAESRLIGNFYYLRIRTKYTANINRETISFYNLSINGIFENKLGAKIYAEARTQVLIKILDKNDNCPLFTKEKFEFVARENSSLGSPIGLVSATDPDEGINSEIFFYSEIASLHSEVKKFPFSINAFSGTIFPTRDLLEFVGQKLTGRVSAIHRGDLSFITCDTISHSQITVSVASDNEHAPQIAVTHLAKYFDPLLEDFPYAEVYVTDKDDDANGGRISRYPIFVTSSSHTSVRLSLVATGVINRYVLTLRSLSSSLHSDTLMASLEARDLALHPRSTRLALSIPLAQFRNINLLTVPPFVSVTIPENAIVNSTVLLLKTLLNSTNAASLARLQFAWISDPDGAFLTGGVRVSLSGVVSVERELNAEDYGAREKNLLIGVSMTEAPNDKKIFTMRVLIDDVNEFPPVVNNNGTLILVKENTGLDETVLIIEAYDPDISRTALTYYLFDQEELPFSLGSSATNTLIIKDQLDAETMQRKFSVRVLISDSGLPLPRSVVAYYEIEITDENEYKPEFLYQFCNLFVSREAPYDFKLGHFIAEDLDRDWRERVRISIASVSIQEPCFSINPQTGTIVLLCSLRSRNLIHLNNIVVQLQANDSLFLSPKLTLNITIVKSNSRALGGQPVLQECKENNVYAKMVENFDQLNQRNRKIKPNSGAEVTKPLIGSRKRPHFVTNISEKIHVREELPMGNVVMIITMETAEEGRDPYESQFVFGIWAEGEHFSFSLKQTRPNQAQIVISDRLDRETVDKYLLTIAVCDQGKPKFCIFEKRLIQVEDINDNRPKFVDSFQMPLALPENYEINKRIIQIEATDADSMNSIQYRLMNFRSTFRMHKQKGWLKLRLSLDREQRDNYQLIIIASDHSVNSKSLTSTLTLSIVVTDINDNKPIFAKSTYILTLPEDLPVGSFLVQLHATDSDTGFNAQLRYAVHGIQSNCFKCDKITGTVHLLCKLSPANEYSLIAVVKDNGRPQHLSSQAEFKIFPQRVQVNTYVPSLKEPIIHAYVRENCNPGTLVTSIRPENFEKILKRFVYTISGQSTGRSVFQINNDGEIRTVSNIDRERHQAFWLFVYIEDRNDVLAHKILAEVFIEVVDENDNSPMPVQAFYVASVMENLLGLHHVVTIEATDADVSNSTVLKYKISSGNPMGYFSISSTGQIFTTERSIDRESLTSYKPNCAFSDLYDLKVKISDSGTPERENSVNVQISIIDINDNAPTFINSNKFFFNRYLSSEVINLHRSKRQNVFIGRVIAVDIDYDLNATVRYTMLKPNSANGELSNNQSLFESFSIDGKSGRLYANISSTIFDNWDNNTLWNYEFMIQVWAFDLGSPTLWSTTAASVTVRLFRAQNATYATSDRNKAKLYLAYQLPDSLSVFYDDCVGSEIVPMSVVDLLDPSGTNLEVDISDSTGPFSILWAQKTTTNRYETQASLIIAEPLINHGEKFLVNITIRNAQIFVEHNMIIYIKFFNKNPPVFHASKQDPLTIDIEDNTKIPKLIYKVKAFVLPPEYSYQLNLSNTDNNEPLIYSISASNDPNTVQKLFYLHSNNGDLNLTGPVNAYRNQTFEIIIEANKKKSAFMKLYIYILDTNNMYPEFLVSRDQCNSYMDALGKIARTQSAILPVMDKLAIQYHLDNSLIIWFNSIDVSMTIGTLLTSISAADQDAGDNGDLYYTITNDSIAWRYFNIDQSSGDIRIKHSLTSIVNRVVFLTIIVKDNGHPARTNQSVIGVKIRDNTILQEQPQLENSQLEFVIKENVPVNTILHCLKLRNSVTYSAAAQFVVISTKPTSSKLFSVTRSTGCIITVSSLDREIIQDVVAMEIQVQSHSGQVSKYNNMISIKIHVTDVNDNAPRFQGPLKIHGIVSESANPGSLVFIKNKSLVSMKALVIHTEDLDEGINAQIDFVIHSTLETYFKIDPHTGVLSLAKSIDRETDGGTVFMSVELIDQGIPPLRSQERLEIEITIDDENDSPPKFEKDSYTQNLILPTFFNAPLLQLKATDLDLNSKIYYSIIHGNKGRFFSIQPDNGWLTISADNVPTSTQLSTVFIISVLASDGKFETKCNVTMYLFDDTRTQPLPLERTNVIWYIPENKEKVPDLVLPRTRFLYFSQETRNIKYILLSENPNVSVEQSTGSLRLINPLDREKQPFFLLLVLARGWDGSYGYINVTVNVTDENDFKPLFLSDQYQFLAHINTSVGVQSIKVKAIDLDAGNNGSVTYSIPYVRPYTYDLKFTIEPNTGVITVQEGPSENLLGKRFTIVVKAVDKGQPSLSSFTDVIVDVVSDKSPLFENSNYSVSMAEDSVLNKVVTTVRAMSSTGHTILYTITRGNDDELFDLDFTTGVIRLVGSLDYESKTHHTLVISATDPSSSLSHSTTVLITVLDCRDERPVFPKTLYSSSVSENMPVNFIVTTISVTPLKNDDKKIEFSIFDIDGSKYCSSRYFAINSTTGVLFTNLHLDFETCTMHEFWIEARYKGGFSQSSRTIMQVKVLDENDNAPVFIQPSFNASISYESVPDSLVVVAMATDLDSNSKLYYKILNDKYNIFKIDSRSGFISFSPRPNFKQFPAITGNVSCFDVLVHDTVHSTITNVTVNFISTTNHPPYFNIKQIHMIVPENATIGTTIGQVLAADTDKNSFGKLQYEIVGGFDSQNFDLDSQSGAIIIKESLNREIKSRYDLRVAVTDGGSKHDFANVLILVTDVNDNVPIIDQSYYEVTVVIDPKLPLTVTQSLLQLHARDKDQSAGYRMDYKLVFPTVSNSPVTIDSITGQIFLKNVWRIPTNDNTTSNVSKHDSKLEVHRLLVQVCEEPIMTYRMASRQLSCSNKVPVTINIFYDAQRKNPVITCSINSVSENNVLLQLVAMCRISPNDSKGKWTLVPGGASNEIQQDFEIDSDYGLIRAKKIMDYELQSQYRINVEYRIQGLPLMSTRSLVIDLTDVNDCYPIFDNSRYSISISEDLPIDSKVIQCKAIDIDFEGKDKVDYMIFQPNQTDVNQIFRIDEHGWIYLASSLNYEDTKTINLIVSASDKARHVTNTSVTILVVDVNDEIPYWGKDPPTDYIEIFETCDQCTGDFPMIIYRLDAKDNDTESQKESIRFLITNQNTSPFYTYFRVSDKGEILLLRPLDAEKIPEPLQLKLLASDRLHWSKNEFILTIKILDINDHTPVCPQVPDLAISEGIQPGSIITNLHAYDRDSSAKFNTLTYKLTECSDPYLLIVESKTGKVILNAPLDREYSSTVNFVVEAYDSESKNCSFKIKIVVLDINDNEPKFTHTKIAPLPENAPLGSVIGKIHAVDIDEGINRRVIYRIVEDSTSSFSINKHSGILRVASLLDREKKSKHNIIVEAADCGRPSRMVQTKIVIQLLDVNDSPPQFLNTPLHLSVSENTSVNCLLMTIKAVSDDIGINAIVSYRIVVEQDQFNLHPTSGDFILAKKLDYEQNREYFITVEASDKGYPSLSTISVVAIQVTDVNDNAPEFPSHPYTFTLFENSPIGKLIGKITASDVDSGLNGKVIYSFTHWLPGFMWTNRSYNHIDHFFRLNPNNGEIFLKFSPDREEQAIYKFQIMATDQGFPPLSSSTNVILEIEDVNDHTPNFSQSQYRFLIQVDRSGIIPEGEYKKIGDRFEVGRMAVSDKDGPTNSRPFHCTLNNRDIGNPFSIISDDATAECILLVTGALSLGVRNLMVTVNDSGLKSLYHRTRIIIDIIRLSNIPPEIEPLNVSYVYFHSSDMGRKEFEIVKVLVRDRSPAYDILKFELVFNDTENPHNRYLKGLFKIDSFSGMITTFEQLDSGIYSLNVRVTNGSLSAEKTIFVKIVALTKEMIESACVIQISTMKPYLFFARRLDLKLEIFLKAAMASKLADIISVKVGSKIKSNRMKRQTSPDDVIDVLVAVYDENENCFFKSSALVSRLTYLSANLSGELGVSSVKIFDNVCGERYNCGEGKCHSNIMINPRQQQSNFPEHGVTFSSLDFSYESSCKCPKYFGGSRCEIPINKCAYRPCASAQICLPNKNVNNGYVCECPPFKSGKYCQTVVDIGSNSSCLDEECLLTRESEPIYFNGGGFLKWNLRDKSQNIRMDVSFSFRLFQKPAPLMEINWNSLRSILIDINGSGKLFIIADHKTIPPIELFESRNIVADGKWHKLRLSVVGVANIPEWWLHVVLDGLRPRLLSLDSWIEGDTYNQTILLGARNYVSSNERVAILNDSMTGCIKQVILNGQRLPYQQLPPSFKTSFIGVLSKNLNYGCSESLLRSICATGVCRNGGLCLQREYNDDPNIQFKCQCQETFTGVNCKIPSSPCRFSPCLHGGRCTDNGIDSGFKCSCPDGLFGPQCQWGKACSALLNPCPSFASCLDQQMSQHFSNAICRCPTTLQGYLCQIDVDECQIRPSLCQQGRGMCHNTHGSYQCNCSLGYGGRHCETDTLVPIFPDVSTFGLSQFHVYIIVGILACLFVLALLTVVILVLRMKPMNNMNCRRRKDQNTALSLDPLYQYNVYNGDQCSRYSPASSMMASSIHHPPGYVGGFMVEPPSTPGGRSQLSFHQVPPSHYGPLSPEAFDRVSLCSSSNDKREFNGPIPVPLSHNNRYIRSSRGQIYLNPAESRQRLSQHSSTFSLVPCNVGPQQHLHLVPNRGSVVYCPTNNQPRLIYDHMMVRNSNLSLHSAQAASAQWEHGDNRLDESAVSMDQPNCPNNNQHHPGQDSTPVNGEIDNSMISWNGQFTEDGMFHRQFVPIREMISSQEMSLTDTTDRSTANLLPKIPPNRINFKMQPPVIHQINITKPNLLTNQNGHTDSPNTVSPSSASIPSGTSSDTKGTAPECEPRDLKKKSKISPDSNSGEGTECDTEDLEMDHQPLCPSVFNSKKHLQEDAEDGLSSVPLLDSIN